MGAILSCPALAENVSTVLEKTSRQRHNDALLTLEEGQEHSSVAVGESRDYELEH